MNKYKIEVNLYEGTDKCTYTEPIEVTAESKDDVYEKIERVMIPQKLNKPLPNMYECPWCGESEGINPMINYCPWCSQKLE